MKDVRHRSTVGGFWVSRTVEEALDYIETELGAQLAETPSFKQAKGLLRQALQHQFPLEDARAAFVAALEESDFLLG
jgi:hypothetical protein